MKIDTDRFQAALRRRFGTPRVLLQHLGLDEDLVAPGSGNSDPATAMRVELENLLGELNLDEKQIGRILEVLTKHASFDRLDDDDPNAERARELAGDDFEKLRGLLRSAGMSEADIDGAVAIAEKARGLPKNALNGGYGGALAKDAARAKSFEERHPLVAQIGGREAPHTRRKIAQDATSTAGAMSFAERHPEASRCL